MSDLALSPSINVLNRTRIKSFPTHKIHAPAIQRRLPAAGGDELPPRLGQVARRFHRGAAARVRTRGGRIGAFRVSCVVCVSGGWEPVRPPRLDWVRLLPGWADPRWIHMIQYTFGRQELDAIDDKLGKMDVGEAKHR